MKEETAHPGIAGEVVRFADFLKCRGFKVFQTGIHDSLRSLEGINLSRKDDFFAALRANLVTSDLEWVQFAGLFDRFWGRPDEGTEEMEKGNPPQKRQTEKGVPEAEFLPDVDPVRSRENDDACDREWLEGVAYSPVSKIEKKDLGRFDKADIRVAELVLKRMMEPFRIHSSLRLKRSRKPGDMDFHRIMRKSLKTEGFPMELLFKQKRKRLKRLVILADVSGSMDRYARFVMPFLLGLRGIGSRAEVFVFSTSLAPITFAIRHFDIEKALERLATEFQGWSGGTRIGHSLHEFNRDHGRRLLSRRTVLIILSDGWDLGGKELLKREMAVLSRKAHCVMWLNPLAGDPDYKPLCQGMRVSLPFVDYFLPADSLESLKRVGRVLSRIMLH